MGEYRLADFDGGVPLAHDKDEVYQRVLAQDLLMREARKVYKAA